ncbi:MAG: hypothetical protein ABIN58_04000 [candidate division WOR-3 bacterium]
MGHPSDDVKIHSVERVGDFYRVRGGDSSGRKGSVDIPVATLERMKRSDGEALMKRGVKGTILSEAR